MPPPGVRDEVPAATDVAIAAPLVDTAHTVLRCGLALMVALAATDVVLVISDSAPVRTLLKGLALVAIAAAGATRIDVAAQLLRPAGRMTIAAALFAVAGALDAGVPTHYAQVAQAIVFLAAVLSAPSWLLACAVVSGAGYVVDLAVQGHSAAWMLHGDGAGLIATQEADTALNAVAGLLAVALLRRCLAGVSTQLRDVRDGGWSLTPQLAIAVRAGGDATLLVRADPAALVGQLTSAEREILGLLAAGNAPKQAARQLAVALPTVRSHIAAAKRKTGSRTLGQLVALFAEGTVAV